MADTLTCTISIEKNGQPLPGFPVVRRVFIEAQSVYRHAQIIGDEAADEKASVTPGEQAH